jgi:hypothetical protein
MDLFLLAQRSGLYVSVDKNHSYIKELAERLNTLESQMQPSMAHTDMQYNGMQDVSSPRGYQEFSPPIDSSLLSRKRTYSMSEGLAGSSFPQPVFNPRQHPTAVGMLKVNLEATRGMVLT